MHERSSKSGLFLMELIIVILFFSLASAITVQIFVKSHTISRNTTALSKSTLIGQNFAEVFRNSNGNLESTVSLLSDSISCSSDTSFTCYYDEDWNFITNKDVNGFQVTGFFLLDGGIHSLTIKVTDLKYDTNVYEITIDKYVGLEDLP